VRDDERVGDAGRLSYLDLSAQEHEERDRLVSHVNQHFSARDRAAPSVKGDPRDLRSRQRRKHALRGGHRRRRQRRFRYWSRHAEEL
jgi:hypothetical protein